MRPDRGFSLIEVVVAVAILSIASVAILRYMSQSLYMIGRAGSTLAYGDALKFYYQEAMRQYPGVEEPEITYENDGYQFIFSFSEPEFLEAEGYPVIPGIALKEVTVVVIQKAGDQEVFRQVAYHVLPQQAIP